PLIRIALALVIFVQRLRDQGLTEPAATYRDSALSICRLAAAAALASGDEDIFSNALGAATGLAENTQSEAYQWAWNAAGRLSSADKMAELREHMERFGRQLDTGAAEYEIGIEEEQRIYTSMATALGVDLSATDEDVAAAVR